jgi:hypothetical protein
MQTLATSQVRSVLYTEGQRREMDRGVRPSRADEQEFPAQSVPTVACLVSQIGLQCFLKANRGGFVQAEIKA